MSEPSAVIPQDKTNLTQETPELHNQIQGEPTGHQKSNKLLKLGVGVALILLLSATLYLGYQNWQLRQLIVSKIQTPTPLVSITPPPDTTANWKTFTDEKYKFQFKLPDYFNISATGLWSEYQNVDYSSIDMGLDAKGNDTNFSGSNGEALTKSILLEVSSNQTSLDSWLSGSKFSLSHKFIKKSVVEKNFKFTALSSGQTGYIDNDRVTGFITISGNKILMVAIRHYANNQDDADEFIDQILSTFKFSN